VWCWIAGSIDANVTGVLIAKRTVLLASKAQTEEAVADVIQDLYVPL